MELPRLLLELQARLDDPDGIRRGAGHDARARGSAEVHPGVLLSVAEVVCDDVLAVAVGEEVDGARGDDPDEGGAEAAEERAEGLFAVDVAGVVESVSQGYAGTYCDG